jgi:hypothetical protein
MLFRNNYLMGNVEPEFCWAKTVRGRPPNRFYLMVQCFTIVPLGRAKLRIIFVRCIYFDH